MTAYSLGPCTIDAASREVRFGEAAQPVPPQVFDVLLYLVEHRERVVPKDELLEAVWGKVVVSESVVARAVMKARRAIQDSADEPRFIKTVQRVGYRFVEPEAFTVMETPSSAEVAPGERPCRIALMPIENRTGDEQLDWISLGLLSLVNQAMAKNGRLAVVPVATVLAAHDVVLAKEAAADRRGLAMNRLLGTDWAVLAVVTRQDDMLTLDFRLVESDGIVQTGFVRCAEPTELGARFARAMETRLLPDGPPTTSLEFDDPLANQAFARALQANEQGKPAFARPLLEVVLAIDPKNLRVRMEHVRVLWRLMDPECLALGERLLQDAMDAGDVRFVASVHGLLIIAWYSIEGCGERMRHHAEQALRLVGECDEQWTIATRAYVNFYAFKTGNAALSLDMLRRTIRAAEQAGDRLRWCIATGNLGATEQEMGNLSVAHRLTAQAIAGFEALGNATQVAFYRSNLVTVQADLGRRRIGLALADEVLQGMSQIPDSPSTSVMLRQLCSLFEDSDSVLNLDASLRLAMASGSSGSRLAQINVLVMRSQRSTCTGDDDEAALLLDRALQLVMQMAEMYAASQVAALLLNCKLRMGLFAEAHVCAASLLALPLLENCAPVRLMHRRALALARHESGNAGAAASELESAMYRAMSGPWPVYVRLDAAWLALERHDLVHARELLRETHFWPDEHPRGMAVKARLLFEERRFNEAHDLLQRALELQPRYAADVSEHLDLYRRAAAGETIAIPPVRRLPSVW